MDEQDIVPRHTDSAKLRDEALALIGVMSRPPTTLCMFSTCVNVHHMTTMIQIRNVPEPMHRELKSRAALSGMSLSDYLLQHISEMLERPTLAELRARLAQDPPVALSTSVADAVRAERDGR